jgi:hypothetical protein
MATASKIFFSKPNWNKNDPFWRFWTPLKKLVESNYYSLTKYQVISPGLSGMKVMHREIERRTGSFDLFLAYHMSKRYPKTIDYKMSYYHHLWHFNHGGYAGYSNLCDKDLITTDKSSEELDRFYREKFEGCARKTKYESSQTKVDNENLPKDFLFIPLQVQNDTVMRLKEIETYDMIQRVVYASKDLDLPVVFKAHPKVSKRCDLTHNVVPKLTEIYRNVFVSKGDVRDLLDNSVATFVINSGVGFESMVRLKPTFTFGKSDYNQAVHFNKSKEDIVDILNKVKPVDEERVKSFLYNWSNQMIDISSPDWQSKILIEMDKYIGKSRK